MARYLETIGESDVSSRGSRMINVVAVKSLVTGNIVDVGQEDQRLSEQYRLLVN